MQKILQTVAEFGIEAARFGISLIPRDQGATLVTLSGDLGAGKTTFVKGVAKALGIGDTVNSPTFVLEKIYELQLEKFKRLIHIDAYRLEKGPDLAALGFDELMQDKNNLVLLEWPEKVAAGLPDPAVRITIEAQPSGSRVVNYG